MWCDFARFSPAGPNLCFGFVSFYVIPNLNMNNFKMNLKPFTLYHFMWPNYQKNNNILGIEQLSWKTILINEVPYTKMQVMAINMAWFINKCSYCAHVCILKCQMIFPNGFYIFLHTKIISNFQVQKIGFFCEAATKTSFDNWSN
jgi:hypothetical protein